VTSKSADGHRFVVAIRVQANGRPHDKLLCCFPGPANGMVFAEEFESRLCLMTAEEREEVQEFVFMAAAFINPGSRKVVTAHRTSWQVRLSLLKAGIEPNPGPNAQQCRAEVTRLKKALTFATRRAERQRRNRQAQRDAKTRAELVAQGVEPNPGPFCQEMLEKGTHGERRCKNVFCAWALRQECLHHAKHEPTLCPGLAKTYSFASGEVWACCYELHKLLAATENKDVLLSAYYMPTKAKLRQSDPGASTSTKVVNERGAESIAHPEQPVASPISSCCSTPSLQVELSSPIVRPPCPAPQTVLPTEVPEPEPVPIKGMWLSGSQFARAQFCRHLGVLALIMGLACVCAARLALPPLNASDNLPAMLNSTAAFIGVSSGESSSWLLLTRRKVETTAAYRVDLLMQRLYKHDRLTYWKVRKWQRLAANKLRGKETWNQYLTRKNTTRSLWVRDTAHAFYATAMFAWNTITMPIWVWSWVADEIRMLRAASSAHDLWDIVFGSYTDEDVSALIMEVPEFNWDSVVCGAKKIGMIIDLLDTRIVWKVQLIVLVQLALFIALSPLLADVHYIDLQAEEDCRIRTNAHVNMCKRPVRAHHYEWFEWYRTRHLYVIDHWVSVALSEFGHKADVHLFLKNVHQKFLRMAELNIPDEDYARYKSDTICYLENYLKGRFQQAGVRQWDAHQQVRC